MKKWQWDVGVGGYVAACVSSSTAWGNDSTFGGAPADLVPLGPATHRGLVDADVRAHRLGEVHRQDGVNFFRYDHCSTQRGYPFEDPALQRK
jgi:hypothetical protein